MESWLSVMYGGRGCEENLLGAGLRIPFLCRNLKLAQLFRGYG